MRNKKGKRLCEFNEAMVREVIVDTQAMGVNVEKEELLTLLHASIEDQELDWSQLIKLHEICPRMTSDIIFHYTLPRVS